MVDHDATFDRLLAVASPVWRLRIGEMRAFGFAPSELVAVVVDAGEGVHVYVFEAAPARMALDALDAGLAARVLDEDGCPSRPLGVVLVRERAGRVHAARYGIDLV
jgi:hypothetical protein